MRTGASPPGQVLKRRTVDAALVVVVAMSSCGAFAVNSIRCCIAIPHVFGEGHESCPVIYSINMTKRLGGQRKDVTDKNVDMIRAPLLSFA